MHLSAKRFRLAAVIKVVHVGVNGVLVAVVEVPTECANFMLMGFTNSLPFIQG